MSWFNDKELSSGVDTIGWNYLQKQKQKQKKTKKKKGKVEDLIKEAINI